MVLIISRISNNTESYLVTNFYRESWLKLVAISKLISYLECANNLVYQL